MLISITKQDTIPISKPFSGQLSQRNMASLQAIQTTNQLQKVCEETHRKQKETLEMLKETVKALADKNIQLKSREIQLNAETSKSTLDQEKTLESLRNLLVRKQKELQEKKEEFEKLNNARKTRYEFGMEVTREHYRGCGKFREIIGDNHALLNWTRIRPKGWTNTP